jgi:hypothetical protein
MHWVTEFMSTNISFAPDPQFQTDSRKAYCKKVGEPVQLRGRPCSASHSMTSNILHRLSTLILHF